MQAIMNNLNHFFLILFAHNFAVFPASITDLDIRSSITGISQPTMIEAMPPVVNKMLSAVTDDQKFIGQSKFDIIPPFSFY